MCNWGAQGCPAPPHCGEAATGNWELQGALNPHPCVCHTSPGSQAVLAWVILSLYHCLHPTLSRFCSLQVLQAPGCHSSPFPPQAASGTCPYLDGECIEVIEHDMVGFGQQCWVTLGEEECHGGTAQP